MPHVEFSYRNFREPDRSLVSAEGSCSLTGGVRKRRMDYSSPESSGSLSAVGRQEEL